MSQTPNNFLTRDNIKQESDDGYFTGKDELNFLQKAQDFYNSIKKESGIYAIQGLRGCGKSTFADIFCRVVKHETGKVKNKQFIRVKFTPRYLTKKDEFYSGLLNAIKHKLLQYKYSSSLAETIDSIKDIVQATDNSWIKSIYHLFSFLQKKSSLDDKIIELKEIINAEYKDCNIVIVLDELDRLMPDDLMEFSKVLDFLRHVIDHLNSEIQIHVLVCCDNVYFERNTTHGNSDIKIGEFYAKFFTKKYDIYEQSIKELKEYLFKHINSENNERIGFDFDMLKVFLYKERSPITIKSVDLIIHKYREIKSTFFEKYPEIESSQNFEKLVFTKMYDKTFFCYMLFLNETHPQKIRSIKTTIDYEYPEYKNDIKTMISGDEKSEDIKDINGLLKAISKKGKLDNLINFSNLNNWYNIIKGSDSVQYIERISDHLFLQYIGNFIQKNNTEKALKLSEKHKINIFTGQYENLLRIYEGTGNNEIEFLNFISECISKGLWESIKKDNQETINNINNIITVIAQIYNNRFQGTIESTDKTKRKESLEKILNKINSLDLFRKRYFVMKLWRLSNQQNTGHREFENFLRKEYDNIEDNKVGIGCQYLKEEAIKSSKELVKKGLIEKIKEETNNNPLGYIQNIRLLYDFISEHTQEQLGNFINIITEEDKQFVGQMIISYANNIESMRTVNGKIPFTMSHERQEEWEKLLEHISVTEIEDSPAEYIARSSERRVINLEEKQEIIELLKRHQSQKSSEEKK